eukprot:TRINITY_DN8383_c0_g1_i2.p1 TRINITY_DN8383_c0_g1~~TRINITY_DN8383_c0_g1_i2.p1  ORF type:complete len:155 (+),score=2.39 TRINITY_DN8383_c0_g1_i2:98-562(+)
MFLFNMFLLKHVSSIVLVVYIIHIVQHNMCCFCKIWKVFRISLSWVDLYFIIFLFQNPHFKHLNPFFQRVQAVTAITVMIFTTYPQFVVNVCNQFQHKAVLLLYIFEAFSDKFELGGFVFYYFLVLEPTFQTFQSVLFLRILAATGISVLLAGE